MEIIRIKKCVYCGKENKRPLSLFCSIKCCSLNYYYNNRTKVINYQIKRWSEKYKNDVEFRKKRQFRDKSRQAHNKSCKLQETDCCQKCGVKEDLQRHHPSYKSIKTVTLCRNCHNKIHSSN